SECKKRLTRPLSPASREKYHRAAPSIAQCNSLDHRPISNATEFPNLSIPPALRSAPDEGGLYPPTHSQAGSPCHRASIRRSISSCCSTETRDECRVAGVEWRAN